MTGVHVRGSPLHCLPIHSTHHIRICENVDVIVVVDEPIVPNTEKRQDSQSHQRQTNQNALRWRMTAVNGNRQRSVCHAAALYADAISHTAQFGRGLIPNLPNHWVSTGASLSNACFGIWGKFFPAFFTRFASYKRTFAATLSIETGAAAPAA